MRNVTVVRRKNDLAYSQNCWVYAEDPKDGDEKIFGRRCRAIGTLRNGGELAFPIEDRATSIFVLSEDNDTQRPPEVYRIPMGQNDVVLEGEITIDPSYGAVFRFDESRSEEVYLQEYRKKRRRIRIAIIAAAIAAAALGAALITSCCLNREETPQSKTETEEQSSVFRVRNLSVTLTDDFEKIEDEQCEAAYLSNTCALFLYRYSFEEYPQIAELTAFDIAESVLTDDAEIKEYDGMPFLEYRWVDSGNAYYSNAFPIKGPDAYWVIEFITFEENAIYLRKSVFEWMKSVTFTE